MKESPLSLLFCFWKNSEGLVSLLKKLKRMCETPCTFILKKWKNLGCLLCLVFEKVWKILRTHIVLFLRRTHESLGSLELFLKMIKRIWGSLFSPFWKSSKASQGFLLSFLKRKWNNLRCSLCLGFGKVWKILVDYLFLGFDKVLFLKNLKESQELHTPFFEKVK